MEDPLLPPKETIDGLELVRSNFFIEAVRDANEILYENRNDGVALAALIAIYEHDFMKRLGSKHYDTYASVSGLARLAKESRELTSKTASYADAQQTFNGVRVVVVEGIPKVMLEFLDEAFVEDVSDEAYTPYSYIDPLNVAEFEMSPKNPKEKTMALLAIRSRTLITSEEFLRMSAIGQRSRLEDMIRMASAEMGLTLGQQITVSADRFIVTFSDMKLPKLWMSVSDQIELLEVNKFPPSGEFAGFVYPELQEMTETDRFEEAGDFSLLSRGIPMMVLKHPTRDGKEEATFMIGLDEIMAMRH